MPEEPERRAIVITPGSPIAEQALAARDDALAWRELLERADPYLRSRLGRHYDGATRGHIVEVLVNLALSTHAHVERLSDICAAAKARESERICK